MTTFPNLYPKDLFTPVPRFRLEYEDGKWFTLGPCSRRTASGLYLYVQIGGVLYVQREGRTPSGHIDIARGVPIEYAGEIRFTPRHRPGFSSFGTTNPVTIELRPVRPNRCVCPRISSGSFIGNSAMDGRHADLTILSGELRLLPESEAYTRLIELSEENQYLAAQLVPKVLKAKALYRELLRHILGRANAHSIKWWLAALAPRLGIVEVLRVLLEESSQAPDGIERAVYFLPGYVGGNEQAQSLLSQLVAATSKRQSEARNQRQGQSASAPANGIRKSSGRKAVDPELLERELQALKQREAELRAQIRRLRGREGEVRKPEQTGPAVAPTSRTVRTKPRKALLG